MISINLSGRNAIIIGGIDGIGLASARRLTEAGAEVTILDDDLTFLKEFPAIKGKKVSLQDMAQIQEAVRSYGKKKNIRINAIAIGTTRIPASKKLWSDPVKLKAHSATIPMNRIAETVDHANCVLFLASPLSSYITGSIIPVDGGLASMQQDFIDINMREGKK